ncbi:MAG: hypothetical protein Unbinned5350contig1004_50 [Prokaryotic dsDNA virus sp.]|nr:MAG: hypothetical protein Unbinned5350contig1004_50 [Prokaryotic dsDNA virus sp.]|tara:strand:+ start:3367 stop:3684 length:318 start_codon:yes stop_codon:yes gene_type:complete
MDKLDKAGSFKFPEITEGLDKLLTAQEETRKETVVTNNLLCALCDLKDAQQDSDDKFRKAWQNAKTNDTRVSLWVLILANAALYLDVIKINSNGTFVNAIISLFN